MDYMQQTIHRWLSQYEYETLRILEVGCGWGRTYTALESMLPKNVLYTWIDFAQGMIDEAKKEAPQAMWQCADMMEYIRWVDSESVDCLLGVASVQHIKWPKQRALFFYYAYRALAQNGCMILTNWSLSHWFLKKYRSSWLLTLPELITDKDMVWNDCLVPWKDYKWTKEAWKRYYHLFTLHELQQHAIHAWFVVRELVYIAQDGTKTSDRTTSRNSFLVVQKAIS